MWKGQLQNMGFKKTHVLNLQNEKQKQGVETHKTKREKGIIKVNQGFELLNGLGFLVTDEQVHNLLDKHTISEAQSLQESLAAIRLNNGHYKGDLIAIDPHRIMSTSQRIMPKKKKQPKEPSRKMIQTFFALDTASGQPIGCGIGSPGANTTRATIDLLKKYRLISQREGESTKDYKYKSFLTLSNKPTTQLLTEMYHKRWSIEEFFNFDGAMGFDRAATFNLNIRYGKMSLALLAQAATYQLRKKLPKPYNRWNSTHLSDAVFSKMDGDIRVLDDTIIVTCYNTPKELDLQRNYQGLPAKLVAEGINPKIPWLYDYKLDFRFK